MKKYILVGVILASLLACLIESMIQNYEKSLKESVYLSTRVQLSAKVLTLKSIIDRNFNFMSALEAYVVTSNYLYNTSDSDVNDYLKTLYKGGGSAAFNYYIAPAGTVKFIYPVEGNESFVNFDLLHDPREMIKRQLERAFQSKAITVNGPFKLAQGNNGLVARKALYRDNTFWGFVSVGLDLDDILNKSEMVQTNNHDSVLAVRIPGHPAFYGSDSVFQGKFFLNTLVLAEGEWEVAAQPNPDRIKEVHLQILLMRLGSYLTLLLVFGFFTSILYQRNKLKLKVASRTQELLLTNEYLISVNKELISGELELRKSEQRFSYMAYTDALTNIPNRVRFHSRLDEVLQQLRDEEALQSATVLYFDLDDFKLVNDTYGHYMGDLLLKEIAKRIQQVELPIDLFARLGGDEFALLLIEQQGEEQICRVVENMLSLLKDPCDLGGQEYYVALSIGIARYPTGGKTVEELFKSADIAMYEAKKAGGSSYKFFNRRMESDTIAKMELVSHLRQALERKELLLHYQPQVDCLKGQIIGVEALLRWNHSTKGYISPATFIPLAEEMGIIIPIGDWVLQQACNQMKIWHDAGLPRIKLAVNLSVKQFQDEQLVDKVRMILQQTGLEAKYLELEITENIGMKDEELGILRELRQLGVSISVDDFGMNYSSLSYLKRFPVTKIKLDQSFIRGIQTDEKDRAMIKTMIFLAQSFGLEVIAEGVESLAEAEYLLENGCSQIQGYYFYRPTEVDGLEEIFHNQSNLKLN
ncbi:bifunctional diguanylate cyclase/phosphodiesterase [Paenibacillus psychroresistens]|nr:EAL domain-containing protein [Paenibacillus psychroresistens]